MNRTEKTELVQSVTERLGKAQSVVLADFRGLTVEQVTDLRSQLRARQVEFKVIKNRLGKIALAEAGSENLDDLLQGNTAWAFGEQDAVDPAKILWEFAKEHEKLVIKGGLLENKRIDAATVEQLAALPSRPELLSMMAGVLKQPATKVVQAMTAGITKIALAFQALADKKEAAGS